MCRDRECVERWRERLYREKQKGSVCKDSERECVCKEIECG